MFWTFLGALVTFALLLAMPLATILGLIGFAIFGGLGAGVGFLIGLAMSFDA